MSGSLPITGGAAAPIGGDAAPITSGPIEDDRTGTPQPTLDESIEAGASSTFAHLPTVAAFNSAGNIYPGQDETIPSDWGQLTDFPGGFVPSRPAQPMTAEDANKQAEAAGATLKPYAPGTTVDQPTFNSQLQDNLTEQKRQKIIADRSSGILSRAIDFGVSALVSLADPLNDMAMMIPGAPEAWTARAIEGMGGGLAARLAGRAGAGALQGAAGMAALQPLAAAQASQDQVDFSWGNALRQIAIGGVFGAVGGGIHAGVGEGLRALSPEAAEAVSKSALARVMTDDPRGVDVQAIVDQDAAQQGYIAASNAREVARAQAAPLLREAAAMREEAAAIPNVTESSGSPESMLNPPARDPIAQARIEAAQEELTRPGAAPSLARQEELHAEIQSLTEGAAPGSDLEQARNESQRQGLLIAADRAEQRAAELQATAQQSARAAATRAVTPTDPELDRTTRNGQNLVKNSPKLEGIDTAKDNTEAGRMVADIKAAHDAALGRGEITEHPSLADAGKDELAKGEAEKAYVAACGFGGA